MSADAVDSDGIDTETLQAQIDLSMSLAQQLVSSWIKPSVKATLPTRKDTEKELQEYMRRPPRLGVGAPIPESAGLSKETTRLKSRLKNNRGTKRTRDDESDSKKHSSDDEEESRAGAIQKTTKVDMPGGPRRKKKKKSGKVKSPPLPQMTPESSCIQRPSDNSVAVAVNHGGHDKPDTSAKASVVSLAFPPTFPPKKRKKRRKLTSTSSDTPNNPLPTPSSRFDHGLRYGNFPSHTKSPLTSDQYGEQASRGVLGSVMSEGKASASLPGRNGDISLTMTPMSPLPPSPSLTKHPQVASALGFPVLNLHGPPPPILGQHEVSEATHGTKKRRRKRKKRKPFTATLSHDA